MNSDLDHQIEYWNRAGPTKPFSHPVNIERFQGLVGGDRRVLDVGCGYGRTLELLRNHGYTRLMGVDIAPAMIAAARSRVPEADVRAISAPPHLPTADNAVDAVMLFSVLTCVPTDEGQRALIEECRRVLRPGGVLYVGDLWLQNDARNLERYARFEEQYGVYGVFELPEGVVVRHHDRRWIDQLLSDFDRLALDELDVITMNGHRSAAFQWFGRRAI